MAASTSTGGPPIRPRPSRTNSRGNEDDDEETAKKKPRFPTDKELEETAAVMSVLAAAPAAIGITGIAKRFAQGRQIEKRVGLTILSLARLGHLSSADNGQTFALRRVG